MQMGSRFAASEEPTMLSMKEWSQSRPGTTAQIDSPVGYVKAGDHNPLPETGSGRYAAASPANQITALNRPPAASASSASPELRVMLKQLVLQVPICGRSKEILPVKEIFKGLKKSHSK